MKTFLKYFITLLVGLLFALSIMFTKDLFSQTNPAKIFHILCDAFFVVGVVITGMGLLIFTSNEGAFDMMIYGVRSFFDLFRKNPSKKYPTFYDYRTSREDKKIKFGFMLTCGVFYIAVSLVMYYFYTRYV